MVDKTLVSPRCVPRENAQCSHGNHKARCYAIIGPAFWTPQPHCQVCDCLQMRNYSEATARGGCGPDFRSGFPLPWGSFVDFFFSFPHRVGGNDTNCNKQNDAKTEAYGCSRKAQTPVRASCKACASHRVNFWISLDTKRGQKEKKQQPG